MRLKQVAVTLALAGAVGLFAAPSQAEPKRKVAVTNNGHTYFVSRDEEGRTRTRVIIQKRSYLDPGTETFPGESEGRDYVQMPGQHATSVLDNTPFGYNQSALPGPFDLPSKYNPWQKY